MIDKSKLLKQYAENLEQSSQKNHYLSYARHFLDNTEGLDRASIDRHIEKLQNHYRPSTVNFAFRVIHRLFVVNGLSWPYRRREAPQIGQRDEYRPQLSPRVIQVMVESAKRGDLLPCERCFLALSTVFGLRRAEIANLRPRDINLRAGSIYVATPNSGRERYHLIPNEIRPYIKAHDFNQRYAPSTITQIFERILVKSGAGKLRRERLGWHSILRALLNNLVNSGVSVPAARAFLRWKGAKGETATPDRWYGNVLVDLGRTEPLPEKTREDGGDEEILAKHPFLGFWRT